MKEINYGGTCRETAKNHTGEVKKMTREETIKAVRDGQVYLGIELGSTRIKTVLMTADFAIAAEGSHTWQSTSCYDTLFLCIFSSILIKVYSVGLQIGGMANIFV